MPADNLANKNELQKDESKTGSRTEWSKITGQNCGILDIANNYAKCSHYS
jgi:hypothetical protein